MACSNTAGLVDMTNNIREWVDDGAPDDLSAKVVGELACDYHDHEMIDVPAAYRCCYDRGGSGGGGVFGDARRIFVTSTDYQGNLGGVAGADANCQTRADAASLGGTWRALISDSTTDARTRSTSRSTYVNMAGDVVAFGFRDLMLSRANVDNIHTVLKNTIGFDELGAANDGNWWNGSDESGRNSGYSSCNDWTTNSGTVGGNVGEGLRMNALPFWGASGNNQNCDRPQHLVCFEE